MLEGTENRIVFIGMDQARDELLYSSVKGKNPFKDKRVRQALYQAIDIDAIQKNDDARPVEADGRDAARRRCRRRPRSRSACRTTRRGRRSCSPTPAIRTASRCTLDCPNNRYVNDEKICQALAAMWSQVGVTTKVNAMPRANYFPKLEKLDTSLVHAGLGRRHDRRDLHAAAGAVDATTARATATTTTAATRTRSSTS